MNWMCFGASGQDEPAPGLVTERCTVRPPDNFPALVQFLSLITSYLVTVRIVTSPEYPTPKICPQSCPDSSVLAATKARVISALSAMWERNRDVRAVVVREATSLSDYDFLSNRFLFKSTPSDGFHLKRYSPAYH